jgi:hypothetical protein
MKQNIELFTTDKQTELVVREGKALELREPLVITIAGDIYTVKNYVEKRYLKSDPLTPEQREAIKEPDYNLQQFYKDTAVVTFDKSNLSISLHVSPQHFYGPKVVGKMEMSDEIKPFYINTDKMFNREQLVKLIRFNKRFFSDAATHESVLSAFQNLSLTGNTDLKQASDTRGNKAAAFSKSLNTSNIPTTFYLFMPIYKGMAAVKFLVEICLDSSDASIGFWFESVELKEVQDKTVDTIFEEQKKEFADFVIVNK